MSYLYVKSDYTLFEFTFRDFNRLHHFPKGLGILFDYLEELAESIGTPIEIDVIGLCCDFVESTIAEALEVTGLDSLDELQDYTTVLEVEDDIIIYQVF